VIKTNGYEAAFLWFGLLQGGVVFVAAWLLRAPEPNELRITKAAKVAQLLRSYSPVEVLATPVFWLLYVMFVLVSASGLMATAQIARIAKDFNLGDTVVFFGATTLTAASSSTMLRTALPDRCSAGCPIRWDAN
jgi:MFS transporter, OFA family, oxalate/formate antiporter